MFAARVSNSYMPNVENYFAIYNAACEGFFGRLKVEFFHGRDWRGVSAERFAAELAEWIRWYREGRLKAFDEGGRKVYDTIAGRRRRLGLAA